MAKRYEPVKSVQELQVGDTVTFGENSGVIKAIKLFLSGDQLIFTVGVQSGPLRGTVTVHESIVRHAPKRIIETYQDFEVGDRVYINPLSGYHGGSVTNPSSEVQGVVAETFPNSVCVRWDNGCNNNYGFERAGFIPDPEQGLHLCLVENTPRVPEKKPDQCKTLDIKGDILFGSDLELFVRDTRTNKIIPAGCLIPGTKSSPYKLTNGVCHPDGLAVEVACPPASTFRQLKANLDAVLKEVKDKFFPEEWYVFDDRCVVQAKDVQDIEQHKQEHPEWFISGCAPELDASQIPTAYHEGVRSWCKYDVNPKVKLRSKDVYCAGFHLHLGFTEWANTAVNRIDAAHLVRRVGVNCRLINTTRSKYYGGARVFRMKPYGIEDRTYGADVFMNHIDALEQTAYEYKKCIMEALNAASARAKCA